MNELKPCPFCGGEARLLLNAKRKIYGKDEYRTGVVACCNVCEARMFYGSEKLAIEAWNRRAESCNNLQSKLQQVATISWPHENDLVFRRDAIGAVLKLTYADGAYGYADAKDLVDSLENLPSAQPERKRGKWVEYDGDWLKTMCKCSECGAMIDINEKDRNFFCYHCGADMRGEQE